MALSGVPLCERVLKSKWQTQFENHYERPKLYKSWNNENLQRACDAVHQGMAIRRAAEEYAIPRSTLHDYITGRSLIGTKSGPKAYLSANEEEELVSFLTGMSSVGYSRSIKDVIEIVQAIVDKKGLEVKVSNSWWKSFKSQHPHLVL